jgi:hypothetical protein
MFRPNLVIFRYRGLNMNYLLQRTISFTCRNFVSNNWITFDVFFRHSGLRKRCPANAQNQTKKNGYNNVQQSSGPRCQVTFLVRISPAFTSPSSVRLHMVSGNSPTGNWCRPVSSDGLCCGTACSAVTLVTRLLSVIITDRWGPLLAAGGSRQTYRIRMLINLKSRDKYIRSA